MPPAENAPAAPLAAWASALVIALVAGLTGWMIADKVSAPLSEKFDAFNGARIDAVRDRSKANDAIVVVVLGSSAIKYATREESAMAESIAARIHRPVEVLRIASNWGSFGDFAPLTPALLDLHPSLVVLQRELLVTDRPQLRNLQLLIEHLRLELGLPSPLTSSRDIETEVQFEYPCWKHRRNRDVAAHMELRADWLAVRPEAPAAVAARRFVDQSLAAGAHVALVQIPLRPDLSDSAARMQDKAMAERHAAAMGDRVLHWNHGPLATDQFCDVTHVTPAGQAVVSDWLESKIAEALAGPAA